MTQTMTHIRLAAGTVEECDACPIVVDMAGVPEWANEHDVNVITTGYYNVAQRQYAGGNRRAAADSLTKAQEASGAYGLGAARRHYPKDQLPSDDLPHREELRFQNPNRRDTYGVYRIDAERSTAVAVAVYDEGNARGVAHQASLHDHGARFVVSRFVGGVGQGTPVVAYVAGDTRDPSIGAMPAADAPAPQDFGMFTPEGNAVVAQVVESIRSRSGATMHTVVVALDIVADLTGHKEAGDTEVRERVVAALAAREYIVRP